MVWDWGAEAMPAFTAAHFQAIVRGSVEASELRGSSIAWPRPGRAEGRIVGGSLSSLRALLGTPWEPEWNGAVLVWEDVGRGTTIWMRF